MGRIEREKRVEKWQRGRCGTDFSRGGIIGIRIKGHYLEGIVSEYDFCI